VTDSQQLQAESNRFNKAFARDVFINILANLVAAAIVYLLGVALGVFRTNVLALAAAMIALLMAGNVLWLLAQTADLRRARLVWVLMLAAGFCALTVAGHALTGGFGEVGKIIYLGAPFIGIPLCLEGATKLILSYRRRPPQYAYSTLLFWYSSDDPDRDTSTAPKNATDAN
jgi:hypothetical protein